MKAAAVLLAAALPLAAAQAQQPQAAAAGPAPSQAERLVFQQAHLAGIRGPRELRYQYVEEADGQPRATDRAVVTLALDGMGRCCDAHGEYLSGAKAVKLPDILGASANPVLLYFMEGEVRRLQQTTKGQAAHFRRRMRQALADEATITEAPIRWGAATVPARSVRIAPFVTDPYRSRFADQAATEYVFVFSDAVPGGVYQLGAAVPGSAARRTLTLEESNP
jgi:hypothetical protein